MARVFIDGFESGDLRLWDVVGEGLAVSTPRSGMTGSYCFYSNAYGGNHLLKYFAAKSELYAAFKYYPHNNNYSKGLAEFRYGGTVLGRVTRVAFTGLLEVRRGDTLLATGSIPTLLNTTYLIEVHYKPHGTSGVFQVKIGGVLDINFSGNTTPGDTSIDNYNLISSSSSYYGLGYFDDLVLDDAAWIGNTRIQGLAPTANGTTNNMTPSAGSNYECVDEKPPSTSDYVYSNTSGHKELYAMENLTGAIAAIKCVTVEPYALGYGNPTPTQLKALVRTGGTNYQGTAKDVLTLTVKRSQHLWETNPNTSAAWAEAEVNAIEAGAELV